MNIFKRVICIALAIAMVSALSACASFGGQKSSVSVPADTFDDGSFIYSIMRPGNQAIAEIETAAKSLRRVLMKTFNGVSVNYLKDTDYEDFDGSYEILIGETNREESQKAKEILIANRSNYVKDFIISVMRDKIVILGMDTESTVAATEWFTETFCKSPEAWSMLKTDFTFIYEHQFTDSSDLINNTPLGDFAVVMPRVVSYIVGMAAEEYIEFYTTYGFQIDSIVDIKETRDYEILIGDCERAESKSVTAEGDNYIIKVIGNKVVIKGGNDLATNRAIQRFHDEVVKGSTSNGIKWSDGYTINGKYDAEEEGAFTLNFSDEFEGNKIDYTKWGDYKTEVEKPTDDSCLGNGGKVYWDDIYDTGKCPYTGSNKRDLIYQSDGKMHMGTQYVTDVDFVASQISTYWTMCFRYGLLEFYAKFADMPACTSFMINGSGTSADAYRERFGTGYASGMSEINLVENYGKPDYLTFNVHRWWNTYSLAGKVTGSAHKMMSSNQYKLYAAGAPEDQRYYYDTEAYNDHIIDGYHMYSFYWDDTGIYFAIDGRTECNYRFIDNVDISMHSSIEYLVPRCRFGCAKYGVPYVPGEHPTYCELLIDYCRLYQTDSVNCQMIKAWPQHQETGTRQVLYPDHQLSRTY